MIAYAQVAKLVHDHVTQCVQGCQCQGKVERDPITRIQTTPQAFQWLDPDRGWGVPTSAAA